jgi:transcriptional regulator with XRE-family HTH domain
MPEASLPADFFPDVVCRCCEKMKHLKFAAKLDTYRRLKGLTISALSAKAGVDADTMERLLAGRNAPNAANLKRIERSLDINFDPEDFEQYEGA